MREVFVLKHLWFLNDDSILILFSKFCDVLRVVHFIGTLSGSDQSPGSSSGERGVPASHSPEEGGVGGVTKGGGKLI